MCPQNSKKIDLSQRELKYGQKPFIIWFTGLSGSGKTTLSTALENYLFENNHMVYVLDGDLMRMGLNQDLGFSNKDRKENIRRVGEVARLFADASFQVIAAFISPFREDRDAVRNSCGSIPFIEVFLDASLETCEKRDPKGLYKKARENCISNFTGISSLYERPKNSEIVIRTDQFTVKECTQQIIEYLEKQEFLDKT
jgi:adenylylsulfate kinase